MNISNISSAYGIGTSSVFPAREKTVVAGGALSSDTVQISLEAMKFFSEARDMFVMVGSMEAKEKEAAEAQERLEKARSTVVGGKVNEYWDSVDSYEGHDYAGWLPENYMKYKEMDEAGQLSDKMKMVFDALGSEMEITDEVMAEGIMAISDEQILKFLPVEVSLKDQLSAALDGRNENLNEAERKLAKWRVMQDTEMIATLEGVENSEEFENIEKPEKLESVDEI